MLLKLYLYGYRNRMRSSRQLAKACQRNVELWCLPAAGAPQQAGLLHYQQPCYKVIADFRKDNATALRKAFWFFNELYLKWELFGGELAAIDGTKIRGQNSRKNNYNAKKTQRHLDYINEKLESYFAEADALDAQEAEMEGKQQRLEDISEKVEKLMDRRGQYDELADKLEESGQQQLSTTDPDTRALPMRMGIVEVGYNVQSAVDDKHCLIAHYEVANERDEALLAEVAIKTKEVLKSEKLEVLADKGYHAGVELQACEQAGITPYVSPKEANNTKKQEAYQKDKFEYDVEQDVYTCPQGKELVSKEHGQAPALVPLQAVSVIIYRL